MQEEPNKYVKELTQEKYKADNGDAYMGSS